jgi:acyl-CoA reductase-like NAD-dependent aldehyde dehydrogenase
MIKYSEKLAVVSKKLFINGELVDSKGNNYFDVINPATEEPIGHAVAATA